MKSLFDKNISRMEVLSFKNSSIKREIRIMVHRNHSFEMISSVMNPFLNYFGLNAVFKYSSYDDSLNFSSDIDADVHILWLDLERYNKNNLSEFLNEKISEFLNLTKAPVILAYIGEMENYTNTASCIVDINEVVASLFDAAFDFAKEKFSGTRLSSRSALKIAQYLGLKIIPSFFMPQIKAIVTDLDNTLYDGILGEDGVQKLVPHIKYQIKLDEFSKKGYMLCIASKNNEADVCNMFKCRDDFSPKINDFTCVKINWESKVANIIDMAKEMNIGLDSILFIDDNIAEIETVNSAIPQVKTLLFENDERAFEVLNLYPGFLKNVLTKEDALRTYDVRANKERQEFAKVLSKEEYFRKLDIKIELSLNNYLHKERIVELLNKTNQFILSYKRYNESEINKLLNSKTHCIVTASMCDKLSDSGIIAILICEEDKGNLVVDELTFSCRALGRNIEDIVISKMLLLSKEYLSTCNTVHIKYLKGQRNIPALSWLSAYSGEILKEKGCIEMCINDEVETYGLNIKENRTCQY